MKYLNLLVFVGLMYWTWQFTHHVPAIPEDVHLSIQTELKNLIATYIKEKRPNSSGLTFTRVWTEKVKDDKVKATFSYYYDDKDAENPEARLQFDGDVLLVRQAKNELEEVWSFAADPNINNETIEFKEPLTIRPEVDEN